MKIMKKRKYLIYFLITTIIAIVISYCWYNIGFREEQIYYATITTYFVSYFIIFPIVFLMLITEEKRE